MKQSRLTDEQRDLLEKHLDAVGRGANLARRKFHGRVTLDDAMSDAVARCVRDLPRYDPAKGASVKTYLSTSAFYGAFEGACDAFGRDRQSDAAKRLKRAEPVDWSAVEHNRDGDAINPALLNATRTSGGLRAMEDREAAEHIIRRVVKSTQDRALLTFIYIHGMTLKEAGRAIGVSESRASQIHTHAMNGARAILSEEAVACR